MFAAPVLLVMLLSVMWLPGAIGILLAEAFALRSWIFHAGNGALTAWIGWSLFGYVDDSRIAVNEPLAVIAAGLAGGLAYWLIAGWSAGFWKPVFRDRQAVGPATRRSRTFATRSHATSRNGDGVRNLLQRLSPHTTAAQTYEEDLREIVLADELGFRDAYISEHHGEPVYIDTVDTLPIPELLMCKAAALTRRIRMGAAVKLIHLAHPVDTAIQAAVTDHVVGGNRFIFGFGSGFPNPLFAEERGLSHEDRHARLREVARSHPEVLDLARCRSTGRADIGAAGTSSPRPAAEQPAHADGDRHRHRGDDRARRARGYTLLSAQLEPAALIRTQGRPLRARRARGGRTTRSQLLTVARYVYLANSRRRRWTICGRRSIMSSASRLRVA